MKKILVVTDLHGQQKILPAIDSYLKSNYYDGVFMLGDLCNRNDKNALDYANNFISIVTQVHRLTLYLVHGNNEPDKVKLLYQQKNLTVHFKSIPLGKYQVVGIGYGDDFPTDPSFAKDKILLTHEPPLATTLKQMKKIAKQKSQLPNSPLCHFSGHLHSKQTIWKIGQTTFVQVPSAMLGKAAVLHLPSQKVEFVEF